MAKRRGKYRMTPRRRAALKQAQLASARKRRRQKLKVGLRVAGTVATGAAISVGSRFVNHHVNQYIANPKKAVDHGKKAHDYIKGKMGKTKELAPAPSLIPVSSPVDWSKRGYL